MPLRQVVEAMGGQVRWDQERQEATVSWPGIIAVIKAGSSAALVNNQHIPMDVEARLQVDRMLVPLRFIAQIGMAELWWDSATSTVYMQLPPGR